MERIAWLDTARGLAIILIVLLHSANWLSDANLASPLWVHINEVFTTLRLPLFFVVSGFLATKWLDTSWRSLLKYKISLLAWVFLLWSGISAVFYTFLGARIQGVHTPVLHSLIGLALSPVRPRFELWFAWALIVFFLVAKALKTVPLPLQFACASCISILWSALPITSNIGWDGSAKNFIFFLVGLYGQKTLINLATHSSWWSTLSIVVIWAAGSVAITHLALARVPGLPLTISLLGVAAGVVASKSLARFKLLRFLGAKTLPVYLAHTPLIMAAVFMLPRHATHLREEWILLASPILLAAVVIILALTLFLVSARFGVAFPYAPPYWFGNLLSRMPRKRPTHGTLVNRD